MYDEGDSVDSNSSSSSPLRKGELVCVLVLEEAILPFALVGLGKVWNDVVDVLDDDERRPANPWGPSVTLTEALADQGEFVSTDEKGLWGLFAAAVEVAILLSVAVLLLGQGRECGGGAKGFVPWKGEVDDDGSLPPVLPAVAVEKVPP